MSPSPRSSVDAAAHSPSSPFLHTLSRRLRKGSAASRASSQSSDAAQSNAESSSQIQDAKSTKRYLHTLLRDDWEYPTTQAHKDELKTQREATAYRLRDESVSEYEPTSSARVSGSGDPYKFDNPDDVGALIERRKARKRRLLEQEIAWNEGLRIWTLRRDAWTGAVVHRPKPKAHERASNWQKRLSRDNKQRTGSDSTGRSSSSAPSWPLPQNGEGGGETTASHGQASTTAEEDAQQDLLDGPYLPIYPPLLPASHTLRSRIKPSAYPTLYSKVVIQSLSPNVPIPLNHMISALVDGWKAEGNWPPQPAEPQTALARRKAKKGESAFQKWKREQDEKRKSAALQAGDVRYLHDGPEQKGVRRSISGAVKKAFGLGTDTADARAVDHDLESMGLTFGSEEQEDEGTAAALQHGHV